MADSPAALKTPLQTRNRMRSPRWGQEGTAEEDWGAQWREDRGACSVSRGGSQQYSVSRGGPGDAVRAGEDWGSNGVSRDQVHAV